MLFNAPYLFEKLQKEVWYFNSQIDWISSLLFSKNLKILEVWSWPGILSNYISSLGNEVIWVDTSKRMLKRARNNFANISFLSNIDNLKSDTFDVILWSSVLNVVPEKSEFLKAYYTLLKKWWKMSFLVPSEFMWCEKGSEIISKRKLSWFSAGALKFWFKNSRKMTELEILQAIKEAGIDGKVSFSYHFENVLLSVVIEKS